MDNWGFIVLLSDNFQIFALGAVLVLLFYYSLFHKSITSILDPLFLSLLGSSLGFSVVVFLYFTGEIALYYLVNYLLTQALFLLFLYWALNSNFKIVNPIINVKNESLFIFSFFLIASIIDVLCQLYVYRMSGFSLFLDSRLETFSGGTGYGLFSRFIDISRSFSLYFVFYYLLSSAKLSVGFRCYIYAYLFFFIFSSILSGSKSAILLAGYVVYCYVLANKSQVDFSLLKKYKKPILFVAILAAIVILYSKTGDFFVAISELASRFVYYGDVYWQAYPGNSLDSIERGNSFYALFSDFLGSFRLVSWVDLPQPMGIDLYQLHHKSDLLTGPNARHNVFGLFYLGYVGSLVFSSILGAVVGFSRKSISSFSKHSHLIKSLSIIVFLKVVAFETDPTLAIAGLDSILMVFPFLFILSCILYFIIKKYAYIYCYS